MSGENKGQMEILNQQYKAFDAIYHDVAVKFGLSDSVFWILYTLCEAEFEYTQNDLANQWHSPKQTVNSAINSLVKSGHVQLEIVPGTRNSKIIRLTDEGIHFTQKTIQPFLKAEKKAFERLSESDRRMYLDLSQKHLTYLKEEVDQIG